MGIIHDWTIPISFLPKGIKGTQWITDHSPYLLVQLKLAKLFLSGLHAGATSKPVIGKMSLTVKRQ